MSAGLPQLGDRGEGWVALQVGLLAVIVAAGAKGRRWPRRARTVRGLAAAGAGLAGAVLFAGALSSLGRQTTPFPKPVEGGSVRRGGVYGMVRHPMYGGVLLLTLAWSLVSSPAALLPWSGAAVFLDAKRRREEAWLAEAHPDYDEYRAEVTHSLVPLVW